MIRLLLLLLLIVGLGAAEAHPLIGVYNTDGGNTVIVHPDRLILDDMGSVEIATITDVEIILKSGMSIAYIFHTDGSLTLVFVQQYEMMHMWRSSP